ncbi:MAG TPA: thiamine pyrophosphate-binding protein [Polyangia bacterium]|nr:thiamine pyrophosphate-binding protein [Polyangia bacterium]
MADRVVDHIAGQLVHCGVRHVFGVGGANIEDLFAAVQRRRPELRAVLGKHEHAAVTAADAYARLTGGLGVVMATSGGGAMNLVHGLAEARASGVPALALVGEPPTNLQGRGAFQDTSGRGGAVDAAAVFAAVSVFCARPASAGELPAALAGAIAAARGPQPGPAVLLLAKDLQTAPLAAAPGELAEPVRAPPADDEALAGAVQLLDRAPVLVIAGDEVARAGAADDLAALVARLDATVCVTPDGRDAFDNGDPRFAGVVGAMGHPAVAAKLAAASVCLVVGTRLPLLARMGLEQILREKPMVALTREPPFVAPAGCVHWQGDLRSNLRRLAAALPPAHRDRQARTATSAPSPTSTAGERLTAATVARMVSRALPAGGVVLADAGNTGAETVHHVAVPPGGRWLLAMGMAGMGWTFGAAVGAACATGRRCTVLAGDGAFFMQGLDVHTALEHDLPITYVVLNNRAHGMCLVRERLLLGAESGYNRFRPAHLGAGLAAMFPGLPAWDCTTLEQVEGALARVRALQGPAVIAVELDAVDVPPFAAFAQPARGNP